MHSRYVGSELEIFAAASNWRSYWVKMVSPHLGDEILEVGAGIGSVTRALSCPENLWTCLEPDLKMVRCLKEQMFASNTVAIAGTIDNVEESASFDTVLYIDVLEHIADNRNELIKAATLLRPGGKIIILAPAHRFLFSPFDTEVGHFRRYSLGTLEALRPIGFSKEVARYLDSLGVLASLANKCLLRQAKPTVRQVHFWDRYLVPVYRFLDPLLFYRLVNSALVIWVKTSSRAGA